MVQMKVIAEPGTHEVVTTCVVNAPRERVFKAHLDPDLIPRWWGPRGLTTKVEKLEPKPGGMWRFVQRDKDGGIYGFHGVYHDITSPERLIYTFEWEGLPGHVLMSTVTFDDLDGKTKVTEQSVFQSVADRDGMMSNGMEGGAAESMERLEELLASR